MVLTMFSGLPIAFILEFPILGQVTAMLHTTLSKARPGLFPTGNVWKAMETFNFGSIYLVMMSIHSTVYYSRAILVLLAGLTVLSIKMELWGWLY